MDAGYASPRAEDCIGGFESPTTCPTSPKCPSAPMKPWTRHQLEATDRTELAVSYARDAILELSEEDRQSPLHLLPRHTLEGVFLAYCMWQSGASAEPFCELLELVPCLGDQILDQVQRCCPGLSWDTWSQQVQQAAFNRQYGQQLAEQFVQAISYSSSRRVLSFS